MVSSRMPSVYVPVEPEGNGIGLPLLLSFLVHGLLIGFIFFTYQVPDIDVPPSIETSIITPEELAEIQANIAANRQAAQASVAQGQEDAQQDISQLPQPTQQPQSHHSTPSASTDAQTAPTITRHSVPVFTQVDEPADSFLDNPDNGYDPEAEAEAQALREFNERALQDANQRLESAAQQIAQLRAEEQQKLEELKTKPTKPDSSRISKTFPAANNRHTQTDSSNDAPTSLSLSEDGNPIIKGSATGTARSTSGGARSSGNNHSAIESRIMSKFVPPANTANQRTVLRVEVAVDGTVLTATANGGTASLERAAVKAAYDASPLPIDSNDSSTYPVFTMGVRGK
ncbi:cell envelope integrity protein TolA [Psychrobacter sp. I-STPA6b]|uniref:cell envelope integrity protein TolA n=1 Tax=Psychrobacter sp. I-STPA6b TaxID=2585718 RepID=UPI001D0C483D|nr:cell envelope integrity protein TolA [Psychrobacter sp. I-STPA6b]